MSYRTVVVSNNYDLSLTKNQLLIKGIEEFELPLEDISAIVLEDPRIKITNRLLSEAAKNNIVMFSCDEKHIPVGVFTSFNSHSRTTKVQKQQIKLSEPFKKRVWQKIICQKLRNQGRVLQLLNRNNWEILFSLSSKVTSGDKENREAIGAKVYFSSLFGNFTREQDNWINSALNYGYAIIRGCIIRAISAAGFIPSLGIHHCSELNGYNLADDIIEPFRPIVDLWVYSNKEGKDELSSIDKRNLINLINYNIKIDDEIHSVKNAIDKMVTSLSTSINKDNYNELLLPDIIGLELHEYE
ncbi:type II CRISPR-associated endonuclease Cas1 [Clostridium thermarum]|uniref:type II CRISPR-associated endonuclease Cas1 n=1 Tax=Clostridium thermarum TaxID=1716543 RepID=UPI0013D792A0|nr:type II CRISPR-associated endonuclease Cas1 [Clostridium thermarum]